jgi:dCMP deaminase
MKTIALVYIPVVHRGYLDFLKRHQDAETICILDSDVIGQFDWLRKDIRSLQPTEVVTALRAVLAAEKMTASVELLDEKKLVEIAKEDVHLILPDEDIMHSLAEKFFSEKEVVYDTVFLRWDSKNTLKEAVVEPTHALTATEFQEKMINKAFQLAEKSADWWRQVGAVIVKGEDTVLAGFNQHVPDQYQTLYNGDPRGNFKKGLYIELTTAFHAEAALISEAAKKGIPLEGAEMFVTTFPCPNCAKSIAYSGIKRLYFQDGYSMVDGESILKEKGVEIIQLSSSSSQS